MNTDQNTLWNAKVLISPFPGCLAAAPAKYTCLSVEETPDSLLADMPHGGDLRNRVVRFQSDRVQSFVLNWFLLNGFGHVAFPRHHGSVTNKISGASHCCPMTLAPNVMTAAHIRAIKVGLVASVLATNSFWKVSSYWIVARAR